MRWDEAWVGKCAGCDDYRMVYEEVEFVCGRCHGTINPGASIPEPVGNALETLYEAKLPVREVLAALWEGGKRGLG